MTMHTNIVTALIIIGLLPLHLQAYYIISAAQEREELLRQGDQLNEKIKVAELEIRQLIKAATHLTGRNEV